MHSQFVVNPRFHGGTKLARGTSFGSLNRSRGTDFFVTDRLVTTLLAVAMDFCALDVVMPYVRIFIMHY